MKTLILSVFALFLLLSADVCSAEIEDDYWVKTDFPDKEVKLISQPVYEYLIAVSIDNEIYICNAEYQSKSLWEKIEHNIEADITSSRYTLLGTEKGIYHIDLYDKTIEKESFLSDSNIAGFSSPDYDRSDYYVFTEYSLWLRSFDYDTDEWSATKCAMPGGYKQLKDIAQYSLRTVGITNSGELYISNDDCQSWKTRIKNPDEEIYTCVEFNTRYETFIVGTDKSLYSLSLTDYTLSKISGYDGGYVSCITDFDYIRLAKTHHKHDETQFSPFGFWSMGIGTANLGVYDLDGTYIQQKNDSLPDLRITSISYNPWGPVYVGTKSRGIYKTQTYLPQSVEPLDLTLYALKISPNPAKSLAGIIFHNPEYAEIEIAIYDLFGRKVADVHSGPLAEGDYNFSADLSGFAAGSYFLKFGVGGRAGSLNLIVE
ncbi:MAG: T9SS type A sorting domain-containing protein [Candidatus Kapabacteria bacterium]|jgi:hypothetical protein|nr:T9SS type A sorting domain-containing protein [Candidatus Kapabacteria bacterium]